MNPNIVYCDISYYSYFRDNNNNGILEEPHIILDLIEIYSRIIKHPDYVYDSNGRVCMGKLKKHLRISIGQFVRDNHLFNDERLNESFNISKKQLNNLLKRNKKPKHISIFTGVIIYYLVETILKHDGKSHLLMINGGDSKKLNFRTEIYFLRRTYNAINNILLIDDEDISNKNFLAANYIIDFMGIINKEYANVKGWYDNKDQYTLRFQSPYDD